MALENIYNEPAVCSGILRIAPRALQIQNVLGGPPKPPSVPSPETPTASLWHIVPPNPPPPRKKSWTRPAKSLPIPHYTVIKH